MGEIIKCVLCVLCYVYILACNTCTFSVNAALLHGVASDCGVGHRSQLMWTLGQYLKSKGMETCMKGPGSVQNSFCFCSSSSGRPPSSFFLFQWELQWETAKNLFTAIKSSRNVLHPFSYHCLGTLSFKKKTVKKGYIVPFWRPPP